MFCHWNLKQKICFGSSARLGSFARNLSDKSETPFMTGPKLALQALKSRAVLTRWFSKCSFAWNLSAKSEPIHDWTKTRFVACRWSSPALRRGGVDFGFRFPKLRNFDDFVSIFPWNLRRQLHGYVYLLKIWSRSSWSQTILRTTSSAWNATKLPEVLELVLGTPNRQSGTL